MNLALILMALLVANAVLETASDAAVRLPAPAALDRSLGEALKARRSTRAFAADRKLSRQQLATLLWAMCGVNRPDPEHPFGGKRTAPSAYGACAVEVLVVSEDGTFTYDSRRQALIPHATLGTEDARARMAASSWIHEAPVQMVLVARFGRYPENVEAARRRDYSYADAAVIGQNLYLACAALGLGTVLTVDVKDGAAEALGLADDEKIVMVLPVGYPEA